MSQTPVTAGEALVDGLLGVLCIPRCWFGGERMCVCAREQQLKGTELKDDIDAVRVVLVRWMGSSLEMWRGLASLCFNTSLVCAESLSAGESTSESAVSANEQLESSYSNTGPGETPGPVINRTDFAGASQGDDPPFLAHEPQTTPAAPLPSNQSTAEETQQASGSYFPYAVALRRGPYGEHLCSGVLIGPQYALTAAKCLDPRLDFTSHRPSIIIGAYSGNNSNAIAQFEVRGPSKALGHCARMLIALQEATMPYDSVIDKNYSLLAGHGSDLYCIPQQIWYLWGA